MIKEVFFLCALSVPPVFIDGPFQEPAYIEMFSLLSDYSAMHKKTVIVIGYDTAIEEALVSAGWAILEPPFYPMSASLLIHLPELWGNLNGLDRIVTDYRVWLKPGGFFVAPPVEVVDDAPIEDAPALIMRGFKRILMKLEINGREFGIWKKRSRWMREAA